MNTIFGRCAGLAAWVLATSLTLSAPAAQAYSTLVAFGDSLSDTGNGLMVSHIGDPGTPYLGGRLSNGPVAAEWLAGRLGVGLQSYALTGATSGATNTDFKAGPPELLFTGMLEQVQRFATDAGGVADRNGLYLLMGGANDFLDVLARPDVTEADLLATTAEVITNLNTAVMQLVGLGARQFLLPLLPDLGAIPAVNDAEVSALIASVNAELALAYRSTLEPLAGDGVRFVLFDTVAAQTAMRTQGPVNGLSDFASPCFAAPAYGGDGTVCANPDQHFFWDPEHPTGRVHELLAADLAAALPEPGSVLLVLAGTALALRRRRRA